MPKPMKPYLVLAVAVLLPGAGHVVVGEPRRGLAFAFFVLLFAMLTYATTTNEQSFIGRHAGGLFIWALSIPDAYRRGYVRALNAHLKR
ncbi:MULTISPECIES: hypothetical protein [unclassified Sinorhizobium]|uniref:hypothetical protein n=1 Tax=unclassified Sinorhizobium TaxID=2613772 RepID=UPI0035261B20